MDKKIKFGRYFYYSTIVISIIILVLAILFLNVKNIEDEDLILQRYVYRYMMIVSVLYVIIPLGCIVREVSLGEYNKGIVILKTLVSIVCGVGALLLIYFTKNLQIAKVATMIGALVLVFSASPSKRDSKKQ